MPLWSPACAAAGRELEAQLAAVSADDFTAAVERELRSRADRFLRGLERYRHHPYMRQVAEPPVPWSEGTTRLLDYAPRGGIPVLVVPSLINRSYILDLEERKSLLRFLAHAGLRPLLVDWGRPGDAERRFTLTDYVAGRLEAAFEAAAGIGGTPLLVVGYCMGGLLALALAQRRRREVAGLALLAAPWDFHVEQPGQARLLASLAEPLAASFALLGELPVDVLQALFATFDPLQVVRKFMRFATLDPDGAAARDFVALEDWLNDGVPLALPVARQCLAGWYGGNETAGGAWHIAGTPVRPERLERPSLVIVPSNDRIVPPKSAMALAERLPQATALTPSLGHIGIIVGRRAQSEVWQPLARWLFSTGVAVRHWTRRSRRS